MVDGILYTSNGSSLITVGANQVNQRITNSLTLDNNRSLRFQTVNTSAYVSMRQQGDDNFVLYSTNTAYGERAIFAVYANSVNSAFDVLAPLKPSGGIVANGSFGNGGQILATSGSGVYWTSVSGTGTVTQVNSGNGLTGGPITSTGTLSVLANTGIVANTTGLYVNSQYIATLDSNNATYLNGTIGSAYVVTSSLAANVATLTANNTNFVGTVTAANVVSNAQLSANLANYQTTAGLSANVATLTSNNASYLGGVAAASYVQNTDSRTLSGNLVFTANVTLKGLIANGGIGVAGQVLTTNGSAVYWSTATSGGVNSAASFRFIDNQFTGNGTTNAYTLSIATQTNSAIVAINGVLQEPVDAYSISGTTITFTENIANNASIDVRIPYLTTDAFMGYSNTLTTSTTAEQTIDSFLTTDYRSATYFAQVTDNTNQNFHVQHITLVHNGSAVFMSEFGAVYSNGSSLATFDASIVSTTLSLVVTPVVANSTIKVIRTTVTV